LILEKAWAKLYKNYERIESGICQSAMRDLTGAPTASVPMTLLPDNKVNPLILSELENTFTKKQSFIITAAALEEERMTVSKLDLGLIGSHAYSVLALKKISY